MKKIYCLMMVVSLTFVSCNQQDKPNGSSSKWQYGDSSGKNLRDQSQIAADRALKQTIRQTLMSDSSFSMYAKNIEIEVNNGTVTLRGPISNAQLKEAITRTVHAVPGVVRVNNQLETTSKY